MENEIIVGEVMVRKTSKYKVSVWSDKDKRYINIKPLFCTQKDPAWRSAKGYVTFPVEIAGEIVQAIQSAMSLKDS